MQRVDVFIETSSRFRGNVERKCGYVLSTQLRNEEKTRKHFGRVSGTYHQAVLLTMTDALDHLTKGCDVYFHVSDLYVTSRLGKIREMADAGWLNAKGKPIANREEWRKVFNAMNQLPDAHKISAKTEMKTKVRFSGVVARSTFVRMPVALHSPRSAAAEDYETLVNEYLDMIGDGNNGEI